jgi:acetyltransferase
LLSSPRRDLEVFLRPATVAVIGATETPGSVGRTLLRNLITTPFGGTVFPVNPKRQSVLGVQAYPSLSALPVSADLAVIATPAASVPALIAESVQTGVKGAIVITAGFREVGPGGMELERQLIDARGESNLRIIGPNCLGVMSPRTGLNATFAAGMARPGNVGFISQSGALLTAILDWSALENVGFSAVVSLGSMLDVGWGDWIDYLGDDPNTTSIIVYMESIGDARAFLSASRAVALRKPIIVLKAGRTDAAAKAAASHTGALAGSDEVLDAAFRRVGVLRVHSIGDLFDMAEVLSKQPRPDGPRLTIITNAGGPGVLATDTLIGGGGQLATLSAETVESLNRILPSAWSHANPIDVLGDAPPDRYTQTLNVAAQNPDSDGLLVILTPQAMTDPVMTAEKLRPLARSLGKPVLASWMGGSSVAAGRSILSGAGIPIFDYPDQAVEAFLYMWRYSYNLRGLYETPSLVTDAELGARASRLVDNQPPGASLRFDSTVVAARNSRRLATEIIAAVRSAGRTLLTEAESKQLLAAAGIPTIETRVATTASEAVRQADEIGYPVVIKLHSLTVTHKTDVGGVVLDLSDGQAVERAFDQIKASVAAKAGPEHFGGVTVQPMVKMTGYELIVGSSVDPQFGPVLLFGAGGQLVEVFRDRSLALPPLNTTLARRMMEQTKVYTALRGIRGRRPVDFAALESLLVRFSQLVIEQPWIKEIDINPLVATEERLVALDARVVLHAPDSDPAALPRPVIRPYPDQYSTMAALADGEAITIRPIRPEDEPLLVQFHKSLSERTVYSRYAQYLSLDQRSAHERLSRVCFVDYDREIALVAQRDDAAGRQVIAVARLVRLANRDDAELALVVSDAFQCQGIGTRLMEQLIQVARQEQMARIIAYIRIDNRAMRRLCEKFSFSIAEDEEMFVATLTLR